MDWRALGEKLRRLLGRRPADSRRELGRRTEEAAARHLRGMGYRIVERNVRLHSGEIDLLAVDGECVVVVEVRSRKEDSAVRPRETLTRDKRRRLRRLAEQVHKRPAYRRMSVRVDVVEVLTDAEDRVVAVEVIRQAC